MSAPWDVAAGRDQLQEQLEQSRGLVRDLTTVLGKRNAEIERLGAALKPFATAAECAYRGAGDSAAGLGLWMPLKFLDAAKDALASTHEQSGDGNG